MTLILEGRPKRIDKETIKQMFDGSMKGDRIIEAIQVLEDRQRREANKKKKH